jgi:hypothetical protein
MQHGQLTKETTSPSWSCDGLLIMLKVMALLAGYAVFVWITMTQLERKYLAPLAASPSAEIGQRQRAVAVTGAGMSAPSATMNPSGARNPVPVATVPPPHRETGKGF